MSKDSNNFSFVEKIKSASSSQKDKGVESIRLLELPKTINYNTELISSLSNIDDSIITLNNQERTENPSIIKLAQDNFEETISKISKNDPLYSSIDTSRYILDELLLKKLQEALKNNTKLCFIKFSQATKELASCSEIIKRINEKCASNLLHYEYYPKDYVYGLLSGDVYLPKDPDNYITKQQVNLEIDNSYLKEHGWVIDKTYYNPESGYYAKLYVNKKTHQIVLAHRGTEICLKDLATDIDDILSKGLGQQQIDCYDATLDAIEYAKVHNYSLSFAGHSLGAYLAEASMVYSHKEGYYKVKCVNFDSPGFGNMFDELKSNIRNHETKIDPRDLYIVTYMSSPNFVNSCNKHIGVVYRVKNKIEKTFPEVDISYTNVKSIIKAFNTIIGHSLSCIIDNFDHKSGKPRDYVKIQDWPAIKYDTKEKKPIIDVNHLNIVRGMLSTTTGKLLPNSQIHIFFRDNIDKSIFTVLKHFIDGTLDASQYFTYFGYTKDDGSYSIIDRPSNDTKFKLTYLSHYTEDKEENRDRILLTNNKRVAKLIKRIEALKKAIYELYDDYPKYDVVLHDLLKYILIKEQGNTNNVSRIYFKSDNSRIDSRSLLDKLAFLLEVIDVDKYIKNNKEAKINNIAQEKKEITFLPAFPNLLESEFIDRDSKIDAIKNLLEKNNLVILRGFGRSGKTTLLEEFGKQESRNNRYKNKVRWINAKTLSDIQTSYRLFAEDLKLNIAGKQPSEIFQTVNRHLFDLKEEVLLLFDNVLIDDNDKELKEFYNKLINISNIKIIITTRSEKLFGEKYQSQEIELESFSKEEARIYLKSRLNGESQEDIEELISVIHSRLPGRLEVAASYIINRELITVKDYIELLKSKKTEEPEIDLSFDVIKVKDPNTWNLFSYLAFLDSKNIPISLLDEFLDSKEIIAGIKLLKKYSLIKVNKEAKTLSIHEDIQTELQKQIISENKPLMIEKLLDKMVRSFPDIDIDKKLNQESKILAVILEQHIKLLFHHYINYKPEYKFLQKNTVSLLKKLTILNQYIFQNYQQVLTYLNIAIEICEENFHSELEDLYNNKSHILAELGQFDKAIEFQKKIIDMLEKRENKSRNDYLDLSASYKNMARICNNQGRFDDALEFINKAIQICQWNSINYELLSMLYEDKASTFSNKRDFDESLKYINRAIKLCEKTLGLNHPNLIELYNSKALIFKAKNELNKALEWMDKAISLSSITVTSLYTNKAYILISQSQLNNAFSKNKLDEALSCLKIAIVAEEKALAVNTGINKERLDNNSINFIKLYYCEAQILKAQDNLPNALISINKAIDITKKILGEDHHELISLYNYKSLILMSQCDLSGAYKYYHLVLKIFTQCKPSIEDLYSINWNLGNVFSKIGDEGKTLNLFIKTLTLLSLDELNDNRFKIQLVREKIKKIEPKFFERKTMWSNQILNQHNQKKDYNKNECETIYPIRKIGKLIENSFTIQQSIQNVILNKIQELTENHNSLTYKLNEYLDESYIKSQLPEELANDENNILTARMLCFEAINLGIMRAEIKNYDIIKEFVRNDSDFVKEVALQHPEYFIDYGIVQACIHAKPGDKDFENHLRECTGVNNIKSNNKDLQK